MSFIPVKKLKAESNRKKTTICVTVGEQHKQKFVAFCNKHGIGQTEMFRQMVDYCCKENTDE